MSKKFTRTIEDFVCGNCGFKVIGTGYTNHCPKCLWSKHVDINPGDRAQTCQGMMKPIGVELDHGEYDIVHQCTKCGKTKKNHVTTGDNFDIILQLSNKA